MSRYFTVLVKGSYSELDTFPAVFAVLAKVLASHSYLADYHHLTVSSESVEDISYIKVDVQCSPQIFRHSFNIYQYLNNSLCIAIEILFIGVNFSC